MVSTGGSLPSLPPFASVASVSASHDDVRDISLPGHHNPATAMAAAAAPPSQEDTVHDEGAMIAATTDGEHAPAIFDSVAPLASLTKKIGRRFSYSEPSESLPRGIPFRPPAHPELELDDSEDHSKLIHAFREPLFPKDPTASLAIAYSHRDAAAEERRRARLRKRATLRELQDLRKEFFAKKRELLEMNSHLKESNRKLGSWTRKVFDLELKEPGCTFNDKLAKLREYHNEHGRVPEHVKKTRGTDEEKQLATFVSGMRNKVKKGHSSVSKFPHRIEALEKLGVHWESESNARFEVMFGKLLEYRREQGTFRMPSLDLCKESGDADLILLHNWVFSQVGSFRYQLKSKKVETVRRFLDAGFSFERWYATNGHVFERDIPPFDAICKRFVENGGSMLESDVEILRVAAANHPNKKRKKYKKKKNKGRKEVENIANPPEYGGTGIEAVALSCGGSGTMSEAAEARSKCENLMTNTEQQNDDARPMERIITDAATEKEQEEIDTGSLETDEIETTVATAPASADEEMMMATEEAPSPVE